MPLTGDDHLVWMRLFAELLSADESQQQRQLMMMLPRRQVPKAREIPGRARQGDDWKVADQPSDLRVLHQQTVRTLFLHIDLHTLFEPCRADLVETAEGQRRDAIA